MSGVLLALAGVLRLCQPIAPSAAASAERLVPGQRVEYELAAGSVRTHALELEAGQFVRLAVVQDGTDLAVAVVTPGGGRTEIDASERQYGSEPASVLAETSGTHLVEVRAKDAGASARYVIESEVRHPADEKDRVRHGAERAMAEGAWLARKRTPKSARVAIQHFDSALQVWRAQGERGWAMETLLQRAAARRLAYDHGGVLEDAGAALSMAREAGDRRAEARALGLMGAAHLDLEQHDLAIETLERARAVPLPGADRQVEAMILGSLGRAYAAQNDVGRRVELARQARELLRGLGDRGLEAWAEIDLGDAYYYASRLTESEEHFREALAIFRALGDHGGEAVARRYLGYCRWSLADPSGLVDFDQLLSVFAADGNRGEEAEAYLALGQWTSYRGDRRKALELYAKALAIYRELRTTAREARALSLIGGALTALREWEPAGSMLREAQRLAPDTYTQSLVAYQLGDFSVETGRFAEARAFFQRVVEDSRSIGYDRGEVNALDRLARLAIEEGDLDGARAHVEAAIALVESLHHRLRSPTLRSTWAAHMRYLYDMYVDVLMGLHRRQPGQGLDERALEAAETSRARGLLDRFVEAGQGIRSGIDPTLLEEERRIQERLSAALDRQLRLGRSPRAKEEEQSAARAVQSLTAEWDDVRTRIKVNSPRFAELRDPEPPTTARLREQVLDDDTALLEYAFNHKRGFLWLVTRQGLTTYILPARPEVENAAGEAYARLTSPAPDTRPDASPPAALARLSRMLLGPAAGALNAKRLLIVTEGALQYVPFAALPHPDAPGEPLLARHEVVTAPSASVIGALRRDVRRAPARRTLLVMADPVFDRHDARLRVAQAAADAPEPPRSAAYDETLRALRSAGLDGRLPRLPFTRREAEAILSLVPPRDRKAALDFEASRTTATDPSLGDFRFVHFATHGLLNSAQPSLSGIVLSLVDRDGADTRGYLTTTDVFNLHLNADMVVLSGCRTALGQELRGEGLVGLSRGFMYAGTPRVVSSLWKVDDAATAELMKRFYRGILKERLAPSAALRAAQLELMRRPRFRDPFYWAAFQLQGEWR